MRYFSLAASTLVLTAGAALAQAPANRPPPLILSSSGFTDGGVIPDKYTQAAGPNMAVSPALSWINTPAGTVSFALIMHDPDTAPRKGSVDILHWMAFNIPGTATSLPEGVPTMPTLADGTVQPNNFGQHPGFMGPGAGPGAYHHYTWELYALDTKLTLGPDASRADVLAAMDGHVIGKAAVEGRFHR